MASNSFGRLFRITTWGESHGKAIGVVIDGCPPGLEISEEEINIALEKRAPGRSPYTSARREPDLAQIYSGVFDGQTTGAPISIIIMNHDTRSLPYKKNQHLIRPGHAQATYLAKYGIFDDLGGGRASARETACRVAASVFAKKILNRAGIHTMAFLSAVSNICLAEFSQNFDELQQQIACSSIFCPNPSIEAQMMSSIAQARDLGDSVGGAVQFLAYGALSGLGDPVYDKLEALLASAMLSIPASKGFEVGEGFAASHMLGSQHNDVFDAVNHTVTNHAGGILGGIANGMPIWGRVGFKPTSSIAISQKTVNKLGESAIFEQAPGSRHDPCVAVRAVPVVEAMLTLVLADAYLMNRCIQ